MSHIIQTSHYTKEIYNQTKTIDAYNELKEFAINYRIVDEDLKPLPIQQQPIVQISFGSLIALIILVIIATFYCRRQRNPIYEDIELVRPRLQVPTYSPPLPPKEK